MKIGVVGTGRLGMPLAVAADIRGHQVVGYDINPEAMRRTGWAHEEAGPNGEPRGFEAALVASRIEFVDTPARLADEMPDIVMVCVQTPHQPQFEGRTPLSDERADFDYTHLKEACQSVAVELRRPTPLVVVSTCLPGTMKREIEPLLAGTDARLVYAPQFIAMGSALRDFLDPEFWLMGTRQETDADIVNSFFLSLANAPTVSTTIENAEAIKVYYNVMIGLKIAFANMVGETAHRLGDVDCDAVMDGLRKATRRLISTAYLTPGMGDGGACHPRDSIALSWLARETGLSFDMVQAVMMAREAHALWLAGMLADEAASRALPMCVLGLAYKPETDLVDGSPALLVTEILKDADALYAYDPHSGREERAGRPPEGQPCVFLLGCAHDEVLRYPFPAGSVVIDPFRKAVAGADVTLLPIGKPHD